MYDKKRDGCIVLCGVPLPVFWLVAATAARRRQPSLVLCVTDCAHLSPFASALRLPGRSRTTAAQPDRRGGLGVVRDDATVKAGLNEAQRVQNPIEDRRKFGGGWAKSVLADEPLQMKEHPKIWFRILSHFDLSLPR